jgi:hypothetical protein
MDRRQVYKEEISGSRSKEALLSAEKILDNTLNSFLADNGADVSFNAKYRKINGNCRTNHLSRPKSLTLKVKVMTGGVCKRRSPKSVSVAVQAAQSGLVPTPGKNWSWIWRLTPGTLSPPLA